MHSLNVLKLKTVGTTMEHWRGRVMLLRLAIVIMFAASLVLSGCSGDDDPNGEVVDVDAVVTDGIDGAGNPEVPPPANINEDALAGLAFDGSGSQFGFPQIDDVRLSFYLNVAGELRYDMNELDDLDGDPDTLEEVEPPIFVGGMVDWDITSNGVPNTGRCVFRDDQGAALDTTVNECTMTVTSDGSCPFGAAGCSGSLALSADALNDSDDVTVVLASNGDVSVNGVFIDNND